MLEIKANKTIFIDGEKLDLGNKSMSEFLLSSLSSPVVLDKDLTLGDFTHILYDIREFISLYCCEEYEVGRVLISAGKMFESCDYLKIFKSAEITTDSFFKLNCQSELCSNHEGQGKIQNVCNLKIVFDNEIIDEDEILREGVGVKADFTLLEIIEVIFEDFIYSLKNDNILI